MLYNLRGDRDVPCTLSWSQIQGQSSYQTGGGQRFILLLCKVSAHLRVCVHKEPEILYHCASRVSCMAKKDKKVTLVQTYCGQTDKSFF